MEERIDLVAGDNLESMVYTLLAAKARGEHVYCIFNGHEFHSDTVTMESAYKEITGKTKEAIDEIEKNAFENYDEFEKENEVVAKRIAEKIKNSRANNNVFITSNTVIKGLKFIAENQNLTQEELVDGLISLGCNFTMDDINKIVSANTSIYEGLAKGDIKSGATVLLNMRDSIKGRLYGNEKFLSVDDEYSIYNFIRMTTGDPDYTKDNIDGLFNQGLKK